MPRRVTDTLIADEHTIYDPDHATDQLVLGIRGQMTELEIDTMIERMVSTRWNKAAGTLDLVRCYLDLICCNSSTEIR